MSNMKTNDENELSKLSTYCHHLKKAKEERCIRTVVPWSGTQKFLLVGLVIMRFLECTCYSLQAPFFPTEAAKKGMSTTVTGLVFGLFSLCVCVSSQFWGHFISRIGVRFVYLSGVMVGGSCVVLFGVLDKGPNGMSYIIMCCLCRSLEGIGFGAFLTATYVIISHEFKDNTATVYGIIQGSVGFGLMAGPPIGGALYAVGGYGFPFYIQGGAFILGGFVSCLFLPAEFSDTEHHEKYPMLQMLRNPQTFVIGFAVTGCSFCIGFISATLAVHLSKFQLSSVVTGFAFLTTPCVYGLTMPFIGWLIDKKGLINSLMIVGDISLVVTFMAIGPAPFLRFIPFELGYQILTLAVFGFSVCCVAAPALKGLLQSASQSGLPDDVNTQGVVSGIVVSSTSLGEFLGPAIGGTLVDIFQFPWAACFCSGISLLSAIMVISYCSYLRVYGKVDISKG